MKKCLLLLASLLLGTHILLALEPDAPIATNSRTGLAMDGYDMVSYFDGAGQKGNSKFASQYRGATWYFISAENKARFDADAEQYMPEFGGYCVYAISKEKTTKGAGKYGQLEDGKLYFNADFFTQKRYNLKTDYYNEKSRENWPKMKQVIQSQKKSK